MLTDELTDDELREGICKLINEEGYQTLGEHFKHSSFEATQTLVITDELLKHMYYTYPNFVYYFVREHSGLALRLCGYWNDCEGFVPDSEIQILEPILRVVPEHTVTDFVYKENV